MKLQTTLSQSPNPAQMMQSGKSMAPPSLDLQASTQTAGTIPGKTKLVPTKPDGSKGSPITLYQLEGGELKPTAEFLSYAGENEAAAKLLDALQTAISVKFAREGDESLGMKGLEHWLVGDKANETMIVFSSKLNPVTGPEYTKSGQPSAAAMYSASTPSPYSNKIDWTNRGTLAGSKAAASNPPNLISAQTQATFENEFQNIPVMGRNLMVLDTEDVMQLSVEELAGKVFHEFFVHFSVPESYRDDQTRFKSKLDWHEQHEEEETFKWDARFQRELKER